MQKRFFLLALLLVTQASAAEPVRCGTDAFGNAVCMDKDGVVSVAPAKQAGTQPDTANGKGQTAKSTGAGTKPGSEEQPPPMRCGIDPFGNKVCLQTK